MSVGPGPVRWYAEDYRGEEPREVWIGTMDEVIDIGPRDRMFRPMEADEGALWPGGFAMDERAHSWWMGSEIRYWLLSVLNPNRYIGWVTEGRHEHRARVWYRGRILLDRPAVGLWAAQMEIERFVENRERGGRG